MAEGLPYIPDRPESDSSDTEKKDKKKKKKGASFSVGKFVADSASAEAKPKNEKLPLAERKPNWKFLGIAEKPQVEDKPKHQPIEKNAETPAHEAKLKDPIEAEVAQAMEHIDEEYKELVETYELPHDALNGGEVIINLRGSAELGPAEKPDVAAEEPTARAADKERPNTEEAEPEQDVEAEAEPVELEPNQSTIEAPEAEDEPADPTQPAASSRPARPSRSTPSSSRPASSSPRGTAHNPAVTPAANPLFGAMPPFGGGGNYAPPVPFPGQPGGPGGPGGYNAAPQPTNPNAAPNIEALVNDAELYGRRKGRSEGFWTGALLVGGYEHFKHRRRERRMKKTFARERQDHAKTVEDMRWDSIRKEQAEKWRAAEAAKYQRPESAAAVVAKPEKAQTEQAIMTDKEREIEAARLKEQLEIPAGHHVERSAWHAVEVDEHGRAVENSAIEYGHEYYQERAHESTPVDQTKLENMTGGVALTAAAMRDIDADDTSEAAQMSRQNLALAEQTQDSSANPQVGFTKRAARAATTPPDSLAGLIPWIIVLIIIAAILWFVT